MINHVKRKCIVILKPQLSYNRMLKRLNQTHWVFIIQKKMCEFIIQKVQPIQHPHWLFYLIMFKLKSHNFLAKSMSLACELAVETLQSSKY